MLSLFRHAGELANERDLGAVTWAGLEDWIETTNEGVVVGKLSALPKNYLAVLLCMTYWEEPTTGEISQPISTVNIQRALAESSLAKLELSDRAIRGIVTDLETIGLANEPVVKGFIRSPQTELRYSVGTKLST